MEINFAKNNILNRINFEGSAIQLAVFRILLGMQIFYSSCSKLFDLLQNAEGSTGTSTVFPDSLDDFIATYLVDYLQVVVPILSLLFIVGLFTRFVTPILFVSFLLLFSFWYIHFDAPVPWLYIWFPLLILSFGKCSDRLSLDSLFFKKSLKFKDRKSNSYRWPIELISGWFVYIYFSAGIAKLFPLTTLFKWMEGGTSQNILYERFLDSLLHYTLKDPLFDYSTNYYVFSILSILSILVELSVVTILFTNKFNWLIAVLIISMHFFLFMTGVPGFMQLALIICVCLINPKYFKDFNSR